MATKYMKWDKSEKALVADKPPKETADTAPRPAGLDVQTLGGDGDVHPPIIAREEKPKRRRSKKTVVVPE